MAKNMFANIGSSPKKAPKKKAIPKKKTVKKKGISKETKEKALAVIEKEKEKPLDTGKYEGLSDLVDESHRAELTAPILKNESLQFKNEQSKIELQKKAGSVFEVEFAEKVYFEFMEKTNNDLIGMNKKIIPKIKTFVSEGDADGLIKMLKKEQKNVFMAIKKAQMKVYEEYLKGM